MKDNRYNQWLVWGACLMLLLAMVCCMVKQEESYSQVERRSLQTRPTFSLEKIWNGKYQEEYEAYVVDQFPGREWLRRVKVEVASKVLRQKVQQDIYVVDGYYGKLEYPLSEASVKNATKQMEQLYHHYVKGQGGKAFLSVIPDKHYFMAKKENYPAIDYEEMVALIKEQTPDLSYIDLFAQLELTDYYQTDSHWRQEEIEGVANCLLEAMNTTVEPETFEEITLEEPFVGVYASQYGGKVEAEEIRYLTHPDFVDCELLDYETMEKLPIYQLEKASGRDPYELFLAGSKSLLQIDNPHGEPGKRLIVFRDSFGSSLAPLLLPHYEQIILIDIRYISATSLAQYVDFAGADVLFLYSTLSLNHSETWKGAMPDQADSQVMPEVGKVSNLRINYLHSPQGIDALPLWFSWETDFPQSGYALTLTNKDNGEVLWESGKIMSTQTINIPYTEPNLEDCTTYQVRVSAYDEQGNQVESDWETFTTGFLNEEPFANASFICLPDGVKGNGEGQACFYRTFAVLDKPVEKAWFVGSSLGIYEAWLNEETIGEELWKPGWTEYRKTLLYQLYDVTSLIKPGENNTLTTMVNDGWWNGDNSFGTYGNHQVAMIARLHIVYEDGTTQELVTDDAWHYETDVAIRYADFFQGETYDFRKQEPCTLKEGGNGEAEEKRVAFSTDFHGRWKSAWMEPVRRIEERVLTCQEGYIYEGTKDNGSTYGEVHKIREKLNQASFPLSLQEGQTLLIDFGQNIAGIPEITFSAEEGTKVQLQFAEMLNDTGKKQGGNDGPAGSLYRANYRAAKTQVEMIAGKEEKMVYEPTFFFTGFRYLTVVVDAPVTIHEVKGIGTGNASAEIGSVVTDHEEITKLFENVMWSQRNNFTLVATDCPQRDERLGWLGDLQSFCKTSLYNQDLYSFYRKWELDLMDSQQLDGAFTDTAPTTINTGAGNAGWADAGILVPWNVYCTYGNTEQLRVLYEPMKQYMLFLEKRSDFSKKDGIGARLAYGDWLAKEETDKHFLAALWYARDALVMEQIAGVLEQPQDAITYRALYERICQYVLQYYVTNPKTLSQTEMCFLLQFGLLDKAEPEIRKQVEEALANAVEEADYRLMTGFAGTPLLLQTLTDMGRTDLAYRVLACEENPSWLYSVKQGATTIWERYDSYTVEKGFANAAMNSFDHFNEGSVAQWMYETMAGISIDLHQEYPIQIAPKLPPKDFPLHQVTASVHSVFGEVKVTWKREGEQGIFDVTIPYNAKAKVVLPITDFEPCVKTGGEYHWEGSLLEED